MLASRFKVKIQSVRAMSVHRMLIDGQLVQAEDSRTASVINPALGKVFDAAPEASAADVRRAVAAAKAAFPAWKTMPFSERASCLEKLADVMTTDQDSLAKMLCQEQGKPLRLALGEVRGAISSASNYAQPISELVPEEYESNERGRCMCIFEPRGVVVGICPWNYPVSMAVRKMLSPAIAGNTVVLKPSPYTPLATLMIAKLAADIFPPGVVNIITGGNDVGQLLVEHPDVTTITFTGSNATGKRIMSSASSKMKKVILELGGNDPAIVLPGSDIRKIAPQIFKKAMLNTGQVCVAIKRLYVHSTQYEEMVSALGERAQKQLKFVGNGLNQGILYGPLNNKMQRDRVEELVKDAKDSGARIVAGGKRVNPAEAPDAYFFQPTIVADASDSTRLVREEQFGPVLPVLKYDDVDEAVHRANASEYGLGSSVWGPDLHTAVAVASKLQSGSIWINTHESSGLNIDAPFGGLKESGIGREKGGKLNFKIFCDEKYVYIPHR